MSLFQTPEEKKMRQIIVHKANYLLNRIFFLNETNFEIIVQT